MKGVGHPSASSLVAPARYRDGIQAPSGRSAMSRRQFGRIRKLASGRWQSRYPDGLGRDLPAPTTFATKADAATYLAKIQTDMERGEWRDPSLGLTAFREWAEEWMESNPAKRATTLARDRTVIETQLMHHLGDQPLAKITPAHIRGCVNVMMSRLAPATVKPTSASSSPSSTRRSTPSSSPAPPPDPSESAADYRESGPP
jgi:Phage integrase, N-terminal SAM-like domain